MSIGHRHRESPALKRVILAGAILCYLGGYGAARMDHFLVHTKSYAGTAGVAGPTVASHGIAPGDSGAPMLGLGTTFATLVASLIFWPMTKAENSLATSKIGTSTPTQPTEATAKSLSKYRAVDTAQPSPT